MTRKWILITMFLLLLFPIRLSFSKDKDSNKPKSTNSWEGVYCIGGDEIESAALRVELTPKEDIAHLTLITGASDDEKDNLKRTYTVHLEKGSFLKMLHQGRIEMILSSDKHPVTAFGGETSFAALVDLARGKNGELQGYIALDGSVYEVSCPKDPKKYFGIDS